MATIHLTHAQKQKLYGSSEDEQLENMLNSGRVRFSYIKKTDGSYRQAFGTRDLTDPAVGFGAVPMGVRTPPPYVITYYDIERGNWRCCYRSNIVWVDDYIHIPD